MNIDASAVRKTDIPWDEIEHDFDMSIGKIIESATDASRRLEVGDLTFAGAAALIETKDDESDAVRCWELRKLFLEKAKALIGNSLENATPAMAADLLAQSPGYPETEATFVLGRIMKSVVIKTAKELGEDQTINTISATVIAGMLQAEIFG